MTGTQSASPLFLNAAADLNLPVGDAYKKRFRSLIHQEGGDLLAAYRLPDDLFADAKATVDVVFLTKGRTQRKWLYTKNVPVAGTQKPMNEYFYHNSHNILGNLEIACM